MCAQQRRPSSSQAVSSTSARARSSSAGSIRPSRAWAIARIDRPLDAQPGLSASAARETVRSQAMYAAALSPWMCRATETVYQSAACSEGLAPAAVGQGALGQREGGVDVAVLRQAHHPGGVLHEGHGPILTEPGRVQGRKSPETDRSVRRR